MELLISSTGGDRRRAHAPEYCLTGSGWQVRDRVRQPLQLRDASIEMQLLTLRREPDADRWLAYWFTDGQQTWTSFLDMLREDTLRRLRGKVTDWHVIRLIGRNEADLRPSPGNWSSACSPRHPHRRIRPRRLFKEEGFGDPNMVDLGDYDRVAGSGVLDRLGGGK